MHVYVTAALLLFCIVTYVCASIVSSIYKRAGVFNDERVKLLIPIKNCNQLKLWKRWYQLSCQSVASINFCFGWTLLFSLCFIFVGFINSTFWMFNSNLYLRFSETSKIVVDLIFFIYTVILLTIICFPVDHLRSQVGYLNSVLNSDI